MRDQLLLVILNEHAELFLENDSSFNQYLLQNSINELLNETSCIYSPLFYSKFVDKGDTKSNFHVFVVKIFESILKFVVSPDNNLPVNCFIFVIVIVMITMFCETSELFESKNERENKREVPDK